MKKFKKHGPPKNYLYFEKRNFLALILKFFSYISGNEDSEKDSLYPQKASYISGNRTFQSKLEKSYYTSGNGNHKKFLIFSYKKAFLTFPETETPSPPKKVYVSGKKFIFQIKVYISGNGSFLYLRRWKP